MVITALLLAACTRQAPGALTPASLPFATDTLRTEQVRAGVTHQFMYASSGPWAIHVVDVRLGQCYSPLAVKGALGATGRRKTSDLMRQLDSTRDVVAGVNADFFSLATGAPTNALVSAGRVITPPNKQPVFAVDSAGMPHITTLEVRGGARFAVDDTALAHVSLAPFHPVEAVGGRPRLVRDSATVPEVDTEGQTGFATGRHPRTAIGIANNGKRLLLVVVDGRQAPYSAGMTLRELATLMLALGARDALNLDGGGSTTMVVENPRSGTLEIANRPSDPTGERTVGDALAVVRGCSNR
jgi:exopolysaccharide biosynthesis protein